MSQPCICIDVSKNTSHVQGFINSIKTPVSKPFKIDHTITGFNKSKTIYDLGEVDYNTIALKVEGIADCFIVLMNVAMFSDISPEMLEESINEKIKIVKERISKIDE